MRPRKILERLPIRCEIGKRFCDQPFYGSIGKIMARKAVQGGFMPAPQLATAGITDRIQALDGREPISPFELKSIERDIDRLKGVSAAEAYMLSGMLSAALGDYGSSKESHLRSLRLAMDDVGLVNYGISMRKLGRLKEAQVNFLKALERSPGSIDILEKVVRTCVFLCDYEDFEAIIARFNKANPESVIEDMECMGNARSIVSHLERLNIPLSEFKMVGEFIEQAMIEFELVADHLHERLSNFDGVQHVYVEIPLAVKSAHKLVAINDRIAELVLGCEEITSWDRLVVNFVDKRSAPTSAVA
jgi:tetratricopeptide (TPR) repeat protein